MNPVAPLGCLYLSIQIESVFAYGRGYKNRTCANGVKVRCATITQIPNIKNMNANC